jgi:hypothetical protein
MPRTGSLDRCNGERVRASWIKACITTGAIIAAVLGTMTVAGGNSTRSELDASSAPSGPPAAGPRGNTQVALRLVY